MAVSKQYLKKYAPAEYKAASNQCFRLSHDRARGLAHRVAVMSAHPKGLSVYLMYRNVKRLGLDVYRTPTATQFYCEVCGVFATSEEQLVMHIEGKKHKRTVALKELTHGHLPAPPDDASSGYWQTLPC